MRRTFARTVFATSGLALPAAALVYSSVVSWPSSGPWSRGITATLAALAIALCLAAFGVAVRLTEEQQLLGDEGRSKRF